MTAVEAESTPRTPASEIHRFISEAFAKVGVPGADCETLARLMTRADLTGADAHGIPLDQAIAEAVDRVLDDPAKRTRDLGGNVNTDQFGDQVRDALEQA